MLKQHYDFKQAVRDNINNSFINKGRTYTDLILQTIEGKILILKRSNTDDFMPGKWCLPGGKLEHGEQPVYGALRECEEETKINFIEDKTGIAIPAQLIKEYVPEKGVKIYYTYIRVIEPTNIILDQNEHEQYAFEFPEHVIDNYELLPGLVRIIYEIFLEPIYGQRIKKSINDNIIKGGVGSGRNKIHYENELINLRKEKILLINKAEKLSKEYKDKFGDVSVESAMSKDEKELIDKRNKAYSDVNEIVFKIRKLLSNG